MTTFLFLLCCVAALACFPLGHGFKFGFVSKWAVNVNNNNNNSPVFNPQAISNLLSNSHNSATQLRMASSSVTITEGVSFDHIAREWRAKFSVDNDKASLAAAQKALTAQLPAIRKVPGVVSVQRVVCGGCLDFKVVTKLAIADFKEWEAAKFAPEEAFLESIKSIPGISAVETQTYTLETL